MPNIGYHKGGYRADFYDANGNPIKWRNPETGAIEDIPKDLKIHMDHIFPNREIPKLPGFDRLTEDQKRFILSDPKNMPPLTASTNCSKGCRVNGTNEPWETYKGDPLPDNYKLWLEKGQANSMVYLQE